ncbi:magnesium transporter CorA family protein [Actinophytocola sediminis]
MARARLYRHGVLEAEDFPLSAAPDHLRDPAATVWLDLCSPTAEDLAVLGEELDLHELAVEDAVLDERQRPKLDRYAGHSFLTAYAVRLDATTGVLAGTELAVFITDRAIVTVRKDDWFDIDAVTARWDSVAELARDGSGFLLHGLLDYLVDTHLDATRALDEQVDALEDLVFADHTDQTELQRRSLDLRRSLTTLRRVVLPMPEVVGTLMRHDHLVDDDLLPYFHDVKDHALRATEWTESLRDLLATIREAQLNIQSNRLNTIMKKVTGWAAVIAVPTAITGYFGQNLPYPGFQQYWGFWMSTVVILVLSGLLYVLFRRRDWL